MDEGRDGGHRRAPAGCITSAVCRVGEGWHRTAGPQARPVPVVGSSRPPRSPRFLPARPPRSAGAAPAGCTGPGCRCLNLSAAARNPKSRRSFPVNIHGAFSAPAVPSPADPGRGRLGSPEPGTGHRAAPPHPHRGSRQPPCPSPGLQHPAHPPGCR